MAQERWVPILSRKPPQAPSDGEEWFTGTGIADRAHFPFNPAPELLRPPLTRVLIGDYSKVILEYAFSDCVGYIGVHEGIGSKPLIEFGTELQSHSALRMKKSFGLDVTFADQSSIREIEYRYRRPLENIMIPVISERGWSADLRFDDCKTLIEIYLGRTWSNREEIMLRDIFTEKMRIASIAVLVAEQRRTELAETVDNYFIQKKEEEVAAIITWPEFESGLANGVAGLSDSEGLFLRDFFDRQHQKWISRKWSSGSVELENSIFIRP